MSIIKCWIVFLCVSVTGHLQVSADDDYIPKQDLIQHEVIVVGGGLAGMAAARKLTNHGYSVRVLEARRERYGGRTWVDRKSLGSGRGAEASMGAMFLKSSIQDNPLIKLAEDLELEMKKVDGLQLHFPEEDKVLTGEAAKDIYKEFVAISEKTVKKFARDTFLSKHFFKPFSDMVKDSPNKRILEAMMKSHNSNSKIDHSILMFKPQKDLGYDTVILDGFDQLVDGIVSGTGSEAPIEIELQTVVKQIKFDEKRKKVLVRTAARKQYVVDKVVMAVPLGVLQAREIDFEPYLPRYIRYASSSVGTLFSNKVVLGFEASFWPADIGIFNMVTENEEDVGFFQTWINLEKLVGKPWLMGSIKGKAAEEVESMNDTVVKEKALQVLSKLFGESVKSQKITKIMRSSWQSDEFTMGASTYPKTGSSNELLEHISTPFCPHLYVAGEYSHVEHIDSALGAYLSGQRAADQIINEYCEKEETENLKNEKKKKFAKVSGDKDRKQRFDDLKKRPHEHLRGGDGLKVKNGAEYLRQQDRDRRGRHTEL